MELATVPGHTGIEVPLADANSRSAQRERRRARNTHVLTQLLGERSDLQGVSPAAEFFAESVRWSA